MEVKKGGVLVEPHFFTEDSVTKKFKLSSMPSASQVGTYNVKIIASAYNVWHPANDFYFTKEDDFVFTIINGCTTATFIDKTVNNMSVKMGTFVSQVI
jgi:hypothetical protein